jgi:aspartyl-tRNA(Asn)/glutamyl-tRNA(Gln) amidotransferase subunit B
MSELQPTIGLEVHAELNTKTKLFCGCLTAFGSPPNSQVCPVCTGMPGVLPVLNRKAFLMSVKAALAFGCRLHTTTSFDRKNYYYPDLPKNYQISQNCHNLGVDGCLEIDAGGAARRIGITNVHLEEDAGKSLHPEGSAEDRTMIDLNRTGVPLLEIVSDPDMHSVEEATAYMHAIRNTLLYLGVSTCRMEQGALRFEASISLAPAGSDRLGNRVEIKNLNSMKAVQKALAYEMERQTSLLEGGDEVPSETLLWNESLERSEPMRRKEVAQDYRYFPEPDLVPVTLSPELLEEIRKELPELPLPRRRRFVSEYGLPEYDAEVLTQDKPVADYFEAVARDCGDAKAASNWVMTNVLSDLKEQGIGVGEFSTSLPPDALARIIRMVADGTTSIVSAREIYAAALSTGRPPAEILEEKALGQISDGSELESVVAAVLDENPQAVADLRAGKKQATGFLVGQVMRKTRGKANPRLVNEILGKRLGN